MAWAFQPLPLGGASSAGTPFSAAEVPSTRGAEPLRRPHDAAPYAQSLAFVPATTAPVEPTLAAVPPVAPRFRRHDAATYALTLAFVPAPAAAAVPALATVLPAVPTSRRFSAAAYALTLAFVPLLAASPTEAAPGQGGAIARGAEQRQYQAFVGPLVPLGGETITVDKWQGTQPDRLTARSVSPASSVVAPVHVPDVTQPVPVLSWKSIAPDLVRAARRGVGREGSVGPLLVVVAPAVPDLSWQSAPSIPSVPRPRRPLGGRVEVPDPSALASGPGLTWHHAPAVPARLRPRPSTGAVGVVAPPTPAAVVALDWYVPPALGRMPRKAALPADALTGPVEPPPIVLSWAPTVPGPTVRPSRVVAPGAVMPVEPVVSTPPTTAASPAQQGGAVLRGARVVQYQALAGPVLVPPPAVVVPYDWRQPASTPRQGVVRRPSGTVAPVAIVAPAVPGMPWQPMWTLPRRRIVRPSGGLVAPVYVPGVTVAVPAGLPWRPHYPDRVFPRRRAIERGWFGYPFLWPDAAVVVAVGNLWEDISATPGGSLFTGTPPADTGATSFGSPAAGAGTSPFDTGAPDTGTSVFGAPPTPKGKSPWDLP